MSNESDPAGTDNHADPKFTEIDMSGVRIGPDEAADIPTSEIIEEGSGQSGPLFPEKQMITGGLGTIIAIHSETGSVHQEYAEQDQSLSETGEVVGSSGLVYGNTTVVDRVKGGMTQKISAAPPEIRHI